MRANDECGAVGRGLKQGGKWFNKNVIQPGKKAVTQIVKSTTDGMIDNSPLMQGLRLIDKDIATDISQFLKKRKDKIGSAGKEFLEGLGDAVSNPIHTAISLLRLAAGNPDDWERLGDSVLKSFQDDPEKAVYRLGFELFGLKGAGKVAGIVRGKAGTGGKASALAESPAGKTKLANETPNPNGTLAKKGQDAPTKTPDAIPEQAGKGHKPSKHEDTCNPDHPDGPKCFDGPTPMMVGHGRSKSISELKSYAEFGDDCDWVVTRNENDPNGILVLRRVMQKFTRPAPILNLHVRDRIIGTTDEHPFRVEEKDWQPAFGLQIGDMLYDFNGPNVKVEGVARSGRTTTVYNIEVEDCHTYFVGAPEWGFAVWAHNANCPPSTKHENDGGYTTERVLPNGDRIVKGPNGDRWHAPKNRSNMDVAQEASKDVRNGDLSKRIEDRAKELRNEFNTSPNKYMDRGEIRHLRDLSQQRKAAKKAGDTELANELGKKYNLDKARARGKYVHRQLASEFTQLEWFPQGVDAMTKNGVRYEVLRNTENSILRHGTRKGMTDSIWKLVIY